MRRLGVGLVYFSELDPLFREDNPDLSVLELEPETFWEKIHPVGSVDGETYLPNAQAMAKISALPQHKLVHSVGFPVGGSVRHDGHYVTPLVDTVTALGAPWASEHLSFNAIQTGSGVEQIGFLLPPRQTHAGVNMAVCNIRRLASQLPVPFAFETGVNYLQPRSDELSDGKFFSLIAEEADCGILLDLHNLWVNERNGRQPVDEAIAELPLERVWEIHLAGGMMLGDYYLDSHSDAIPDLLLDIAAQVIPRLPNLGALIFEMLPGYVPQLGLDGVKQQLTRLNELWRLRPAESIYVPRRPVVSADRLDGPCDVVEWERTLGTLALGHSQTPADSNQHALAGDTGVKILQTLVGEFRDGRISRAMRFTITLMLAHLGPAAVHDLLNDYHISTFPEDFASGEADRFAQYLRGRLATLPPVPFLANVLDFEHALIRAALYGATSRIEWSVDPAELFSALEAGRLPSSTRTTRIIMDIVPEG
ncbi:MAG: DUF692 domain-containing protein [Acidobacteriia bacterium]|nr:DUF692 domain-containing protein [Terriglobia bacterium]